MMDGGHAATLAFEDPLEASPLCSKVALADSAEDPLEASPLCSKVALAASVEDPLEASPLCSKVALADSVEDPSCKQGLTGYQRSRTGALPAPGGDDG